MTQPASRSEPSEKVIMAMADCLLKTPNTITREEIINAWRVAVSERGTSKPDPECICRGNWREIVKEVAPLIGKQFKDKRGVRYRFFGVIHGEDDYYYGMSRESELRLLSCVGSIEGHGFTLLYERNSTDA